MRYTFYILVLLSISCKQNSIDKQTEYNSEKSKSISEDSVYVNKDSIVKLIEHNQTIRNRYLKNSVNRNYRPSNSFNHIKHIRENSTIGHIDGIPHEPKYLVDYIIEKRLNSKADEKYITDRTLLKKLKMLECKKDQIIIQDTLTNGKICRIVVNAGDFKEEDHVVKVKENGEFRDYVLIDGKFPYGGNYGKITKELQNLTIIIGEEKIEIDWDKLPSINKPNFCKSIWKGEGFEAFEDGDNIYLYVSGGNAASTYFGKLIFNSEEFITSIMVDYLTLSKYGSFGEYFVGF